MKKSKIDKIIESVRRYISLKEEMMTTQSTPTKPGFSAAADAAGPVAGTTPNMLFLKRKENKKHPTGGPGSRKNWIDALKNKYF